MNELRSVLPTDVWGGVRMLAGDPPVETHENVTFIPWGKVTPYNINQAWGVYEGAGEGGLIDLASLRRDEPRHHLGQSLRTETRASQLTAAPDETYIYGGPGFTHYGHFVLSTLARLWQILKEGRGDAKVIFHSHATEDELLTYPFVSAFLKACELGREDIYIPAEPVRVPRLIVPGAALEEQSFVYEAYRDAAHILGRRFGVDERRELTTAAVYVTKSRLEAGAQRLEREAEVESVMRAHGVEVVSPEEMIISDQLRLFTSGRTVIGSAGSAFHSSAFGPAAGKLVGLVMSEKLNSNFLLIDKVNGNSAEYLMPLTEPGRQFGAAGFNQLIEHGADLTLLAEELVAIALG